MISTMSGIVGICGNDWLLNQKNRSRYAQITEREKKIKRLSKV
jgi:hypothetical protein